MMQLHKPPSQQSGSVLLVAMVFLLLFALIAASVYRGSITSVQALGNMQWRTESINAANDAIERLLSDPATFANATTIGATLNATPIAFDANGDGVNDIKVKFLNNTGPECKRSEQVAASSLDVTNPDDVACMGSGVSSNTGLGITTGTATAALGQITSLCADAEWSITVQAVDSVTNTSVNVVQGVGVRVPVTSIPTACN